MAAIVSDKWSTLLNQIAWCRRRRRCRRRSLMAANEVVTYLRGKRRWVPSLGAPLADRGDDGFIKRWHCA